MPYLTNYSILVGSATLSFVSTRIILDSFILGGGGCKRPSLILSCFSFSFSNLWRLLSFLRSSDVRQIGITMFCCWFGRPSFLKGFGCSIKFVILSFRQVSWVYMKSVSYNLASWTFIISRLSSTFILRLFSLSLSKFQSAEFNVSLIKLLFVALLSQFEVKLLHAILSYQSKGK